MTIKQLNAFELLIVERLRLELRRCDIWEQELPTPAGKQLVEKLRSNARLRSEIWFDIIDLLRRKERIKRLRGKAKEEAKLKYALHAEEVNRRWSAVRADIFPSSPRSNAPTSPAPTRSVLLCPVHDSHGRAASNGN